MIAKTTAQKILSKFPQTNILVVGDLILDKYLWGEVERISPEAPVPIVDVKKETVNLGGACNVAWNISALDGNAFIAGVIGDDENGKILEQLLKEKNINPILVKDTSRPTTEKTRIIAVSQQLMRIDRENRDNLDSKIEENLIEKIKEIIEKIDIIVVSDYGKGVITEKIMNFLKNTGKPVFVDPKPSNVHLYEEITIMTPNKKEAFELAGLPRNMEIEELGKYLMKKLKMKQLLITLGAEGMALFENGKITKIPAKARKVFDVTGAGDTVISVLALARASGGTWEESASLANYAAGYVVGEIGTAVVDRDLLLSLIPEN
ncbi:MAG: D-glycero-beta-D-manno-heptose-7-phosphate kinase [Aquificae bacterium]|nr:D-glycero-beta-D-manno-heptose-7-phosphate kinase [Aquificota bacterium]